MNSTKERIRPKRPKSRITMADRDGMRRPEALLEESVSSRIEALLARADGLMTGKEYNVLFDAGGEQHARADEKAGKMGNGSRPGAPGSRRDASSAHIYIDMGFKKSDLISKRALWAPRRPVDDD